MKNQYFGDINDFWKFFILRKIGKSGISSIFIVWMLTPDDKKNHDGRKTDYLCSPRRKGSPSDYDVELFNNLQRVVCQNKNMARRVVQCEEMGLLNNAGYFYEEVPAGSTARKAWFECAKQASFGHDLTFFDPDNGFEVSSVNKNRGKSIKYLYWDELAEMLTSGSSVMVYQHFSREPRMDHMQRIAVRCHLLARQHKIIIVASAHAFFILVLHRKFSLGILKLLDEIKGISPDYLKAYRTLFDCNGEISIEKLEQGNHLLPEHLEYLASLKRTDLGPLFDMIPRIENTESFTFIRPEAFTSHAVEFPIFTENEIIDQFSKCAYELKLVLPFDWMHWEEGRAFLEEEKSFDGLDIVTLCKLVSAILRNDRFCEGYLASMFENGKILKIMHAMESCVMMENQEEED